MRNLIQNYGYYIVGAAIVGAVLLLTLRGNSSSKEAALMAKAATTYFFVDEETGEESVLTTRDYPPLMGKNGRPTLVRAYKFTPDGGKTEAIVYLEKYTDDAIEELKSTDDEFRRNELYMTGRLIRLHGDNQKWMPAHTSEAERLIESARKAIRLPDGSEVVLVYPKVN